MPMSNYNRANPFMYITETAQETLVQKTEFLIRAFIRQVILSVFTVGVIVAQYIITGKLSPFVYSVMIFLGVIFSYLQMRRAIIDSKRDEMNEMILGDHYKDINVNNEKLLTETMQYHESIGRVEFAIESCYFMWFLSIVSISHCVLNILIYCFS